MRLQASLAEQWEVKSRTLYAGTLNFEAKTSTCGWALETPRRAHLRKVLVHHRRRLRKLMELVECEQRQPLHFDVSSFENAPLHTPHQMQSPFGFG